MAIEHDHARASRSNSTSGSVGWSCWLADWTRLTVFFDYAPDIRKVIYTTNVIESLNDSLRRGIKNRGAFPSDEAIAKVLYLGLHNVAKKWPRAFQNWAAALNQVGIPFGDRMTV